MKRREFVSGGCAALALATWARQGFGQEGSEQIAARPIASTGELLPIVGYGQSPSFRENDVENSAKLLDVMRELGGAFIDTGASAQQIIGDYLRQNSAHEQFFLGTNLTSRDAESDLESIETARRLQGKNELDLIQLWRPANIGESWSRLKQYKDEGYTRYIGIAGTGREYLDVVRQLLADDQPDFIQINYSILEPETGIDIIPAAREKGVAVVTNRPFVNGQYFPLIADKELPAWTAEFDCQSWAQFSIKWILGNPAVNCVLAETTKAHHALDNLSAGLGRLPDEATRRRMQDFIRSL